MSSVDLFLGSRRTFENLRYFSRILKALPGPQNPELLLSEAAESQTFRAGMELGSSSGGARWRDD